MILCYDIIFNCYLLSEGNKDNKTWVIIKIKTTELFEFINLKIEQNMVKNLPNIQQFLLKIVKIKLKFNTCGWIPRLNCVWKLSHNIYQS